MSNIAIETQKSQENVALKERLQAYADGMKKLKNKSGGKGEARV